MIANQCKHNPQQFAGDGHQSFFLGHAPAAVPLVGVMQNTILTDHIEGSKNNILRINARPLLEMCRCP